MIDPEINLSWLFNFQSQNINSPLPVNSQYSDNSDFEENLKNSQRKLEDKKDADENIFSTFMPCFNPLFRLKDFSSMNTDEKLNTDSFKTADKKNTDKSIQIDSVKNSFSAQTDSNLQKRYQSNFESDNKKQQLSPVVARVMRTLFESNKSGVSTLNLVSSQELIKNIYEKTDILNIKTISSKIIDEAKLLKEGEKTEIIIDLKPEWLGSIILKISSDKGVLNVNIFANESAKSLIDASISELEKALKAANLNIGSLHVSVGGQSQGKREKFIPVEFDFLIKETAKPISPENPILERFFALKRSENIIYSKI